MNNQFEGRNYVSRNFTTNITTTEYVQTLFPRISSSKAREIAEMYQGIGFNSVFEQASEVMGDCEWRFMFTPRRHSYYQEPAHFVCPTFTMLEHYPRASFKVLDICKSTDPCTSAHFTNRESLPFPQQIMERILCTTFQVTRTLLFRCMNDTFLWDIACQRPTIQEPTIYHLILPIVPRNCQVTWSKWYTGPK